MRSVAPTVQTTDLIQSLPARRAHLEDLVREYLSLQREICSFITNAVISLFFNSILWRVLYEGLCALVTGNRMRTSLFEDPLSSDVRDQLDVRGQLIIGVLVTCLIGIFVKVPSILDSLVYSYRRPFDSPEIKKAIALAHNTNSADNEVNALIQNLQQKISQDHKLIEKIRVSYPLIYLCALMGRSTHFVIAWVEHDLKEQGFQFVKLSPLLRVLYDIFSFYQYKKAKLKADTAFTKILSQLLHGIPYIVCLTKNPGVYSTFFEIVYQAGLHNKITFEINEKKIHLQFKHIIKEFLNILDQISGIELTRFDLDGIAIKPSTLLPDPAQIIAARESFLLRLANRTIVFKSQERLLPIFRKAFADTKLNWVSLCTLQGDNNFGLEFVADITKLEHAFLTSHLIKPLQNIFDNKNVKALHGEIAITVTSDNVCTNFTQRINQIASVFLEASQPKVAPALPAISSVPVAAAAATADYATPIALTSSTHKNLNTNDKPGNDSLPTQRPVGFRQIDWPSHPSFTTGQAKQKVTAMYGSHTLAFSRFFYVDKNLKHAFKDQPLYKNFKKSMKNGHIISDKGTGFKRSNVSYMNCHGQRQQAVFKFKFANEDSRIFVRIADAETHPRQMLYIADGFKAHTHKR